MSTAVTEGQRYGFFRSVFNPLDAASVSMARTNYINNAGDPGAMTIAGEGYRQGMRGLLRTQAAVEASRTARDLVGQDAMFGALPPDVQLQVAALATDRMLDRVGADDSWMPDFIHPDNIEGHYNDVRNHVRNVTYAGTEGRASDSAQVLSNVLTPEVYAQVSAVAIDANVEAVRQHTRDALASHPHYRHLPASQLDNLADIAAQNAGNRMMTGLQTYMENPEEGLAAMQTAMEPTRFLAETTVPGQTDMRGFNRSGLGPSAAIAELDSVLEATLPEQVWSSLQSEDTERVIQHYSGGLSADDRVRVAYPEFDHSPMDSDDAGYFAETGMQREMSPTELLEQHNARLEAIREVMPDMVQDRFSGYDDIGEQYEGYWDAVLPGMHIDESTSLGDALAQAEAMGTGIEATALGRGIDDGDRYLDPFEMAKLEEYYAGLPRDEMVLNSSLGDTYMRNLGAAQARLTPRAVMGDARWGRREDPRTQMSPEFLYELQSQLDPQAFQNMLAEYGMEYGFDSVASPLGERRAYVDEAGNQRFLAEGEEAPIGAREITVGHNVWQAPQVEERFRWNRPAYRSYDPRTGRHNVHWYSSDEGGGRPTDLADHVQVEEGGYWAVNPETGRPTRIAPGAVAAGFQYDTALTDPVRAAAWMETAMRRNPGFFLSRNPEAQEQFRQNVMHASRRYAAEQGNLTNPYEDARPFLMGYNNQPQYERAGQAVTWDQVYAQARQNPNAWRQYMPEAYRGGAEASQYVPGADFDPATNPLYSQYWDTRGGQEAWQNWNQTTTPAIQPQAPVRPAPTAAVSSGRSSISMDPAPIQGHQMIATPE